MMDKVEVETDLGEIRMVAQMALDRLGYNPGNGAPQAREGGSGVQVNFYNVSPDLLTQARRAILGRGEETARRTIEGEFSALPDTTTSSEVQTRDGG
jgi:hypothetical protein